MPLTWNPLKLEVGDTALLQYCTFLLPFSIRHFDIGLQVPHPVQSTASRSLATFGHDATDLGNVLIRVALASNTASAVAVLRSVLALSSLHRHDVHSHAVELKISALKSLTAAANNLVGTVEAVQHVAAGMLLCSFEVSIKP